MQLHRAFNEEVKTDFGNGLEDEKEYTIEGNHHHPRLRLRVRMLS
jgi:hypothetical protein